MTLSPDDDFAAAEFALGTLEPSERATFAARRRREPELDAAIRAWEARLSPLAEATPPIAPPSDFLSAIEARIRAAAPPPAADGVAALQRRLSRWRASINLATGELSVRPVAAPPQAGKSYELWIIEPKLGAPRSLGVIDAASVTRGARLAAFDRAVVEDATYAVTVEPEGGSPDGKPSGPPVFVGKLVPVEP